MNRREMMFATLAAATPLASCASAAKASARQAMSPSASSEVSDIIEEVMAHEHIPAASVCAVLGDQTILSQTHGKASLIFDAPVTSSTLFAIGSVSKHVTAIAVLRLADQGRLSLDAPLSHFLAEVSPEWGTRTLRHILSHVSGLPDYFNGFGFSSFDRPVTRETMYELTRNIPPIAPPGEAFFYSNAGYTLIGYVIEEVTSESYADHIEKLFREYGLPHARGDDGQAVIKNRADGYKWQDGKYMRSVQMASTTSAVAAGGLLMTAEDIPGWSAALASSSLLSDESRELLYESWAYPTGRSSGYSMGWRTDTLDGKTPFYHHTGFVPDYTTLHLRQPATGLEMMVMSTGNGSIQDLGFRIAEKICPQSTPMSLKEIPDGNPDLTATISDIVLRSTPVDSGYFAKELRILPAFVQDYVTPKLSEAQRENLQSITLVQDTRQGKDWWRRYRVLAGNKISHLIAAYDEQGKIGFLRRA